MAWCRSYTFLFLKYIAVMIIIGPMIPIIWIRMIWRKGIQEVHWNWQGNTKREQYVTGTAQNGTVLSFMGYLRSVIISDPTKRWNGSIIFRTPSNTAKRISTIQSYMCRRATLDPWDVIQGVGAPKRIGGAGAGIASWVLKLLTNWINLQNPLYNKLEIQYMIPWTN